MLCLYNRVHQGGGEVFWKVADRPVIFITISFLQNTQNFSKTWTVSLFAVIIKHTWLVTSQL